MCWVMGDVERCKGILIGNEHGITRARTGASHNIRPSPGGEENHSQMEWNIKGDSKYEEEGRDVLKGIKME